MSDSKLPYKLEIMESIPTVRHRKSSWFELVGFVSKTIHRFQEILIQAAQKLFKNSQKPLKICQKPFKICEKPTVHLKNETH